MKTLLAVREQEYAWVREAFPAIHPLLLPLCNKPFIEYLIDFAILTGSSDIRLISDASMAEVAQFCENGSRWGIGISYGTLHEEDTLKSMLDKNRRFCGEERVMIINGFCFIRYDKRQDYASMAATLPEGVWASCPGGSITFSGPPAGTQTEPGESSLSLLPLDTMTGFYAASMEILETGSDLYVLPGYGGEPGCAIGRNVIISKSVEIRKPVSIGNNVQLLSDTVIGPSTIIGNNVIIDRESRVASSIVLDNTYIGLHLELNERIASGNRLTEPRSGVSIAMEDPHLLSGIRRGSRLRSAPRKLVHALAASILILLLCIPFILCWLPLRLGGRWKSKKTAYLSGEEGRILRLAEVELPSSGVLATLAGALSLERFTRLFRVVTGQLSLIGSTLAAGDTDSAHLLWGTTSYRPAVFSYAEAEEWPTGGSDAAIVEHFHLAHSSPLSDIALTFRAFINRLQEKSTS